MADGSPVSNTDYKHPYRVHGIEYSLGIAIICADTVMNIEPTYEKTVYVAQKGTKHVANAYTGYKLVGTIPAADGNNREFWSGDLTLDTETGAYYPSTVGSGEAVGTGDIVWAGGKNTGIREYYTCGALGVGAVAGAGFVDCWNGLGGAGWSCGSAD